MPRNIETDKVSAVDIPPNNDPKDRIWRGTISFTNPFFYEDTIRIMQDMAKTEIHYPPETSQPITINFPDTIKINSPTRVQILNWNPSEQMICLDDYRIASFNPDTQVLTPQSFGTFTIKVMSKKTTSNNFTPTILASKEVTVVT